MTGEKRTDLKYSALRKSRAAAPGLPLMFHRQTMNGISGSLPEPDLNRHIASPW
jgi:hypothetical protein